MSPTMSGTGVRRLNWGSGPVGAPGWINSDLRPGPGVDCPADIRDGLPIAGDSMDYAVGIHALQDLPYPDISGALAELRRVLKPGGVLRLSLPDLDRALTAYRTGDRAYFYVKDDEASNIGSKLCIQMTWYGSNRCVFTYGFIAEMLEKADFRRVVRCAFRKTSSPYPEIVELDNRERESLFVEAVK